jgi:3'-phosphoadenosine 5'-phosphosulfate (PAPS) 3'-phosphatase
MGARMVSRATAPLPTEVTAVIDQAFAVAESAVVSAGDYLAAEQRQAMGRGENKADGSWVSHADLESERRVVGSIRQAFPTHAIVGEENIAAPVAPSDFVWYVDPLDGTSNFLGKNPGRENRWGVLIGLLYRGNPVFGLSYFPGLPGPDGRPLFLKARADDPPGLWVGDKFHTPVEESLLPSHPRDWTVMGHGDYRGGRPFPALERVERVFGRTESHASSIALWLALMALTKVGISLPGFPLNPAAYAKEEVKEWDVVGPSVLLAQVGGVISLNFGGTSFFPLPRSSTGENSRAGFSAALGSSH